MVRTRTEQQKHARILRVNKQTKVKDATNIMHPLPVRARGFVSMTEKVDRRRRKDEQQEVPHEARKKISNVENKSSILYPVLTRTALRNNARQKISEIQVEQSFVFSRLGFIRSEGKIYKGAWVIYRFRWHMRYRYTRISIRPLLAQKRTHENVLRGGI